MPSDRKTARNEILSRLRATVEALSAPPGPLTVIYDDVKKTQPKIADPDPLSSWARAKIQHLQGKQSSLSSDNGRKRWRRDGFLVVQLFTPNDDGLNLSDNLASIIQGAYEAYATPSGVWFRNARSVEIGTSGAWFQVNIFVDFTYDEVK